MYYSLIDYIDSVYNASSTITTGKIDDGYVGVSNYRLNGDNYEIKQVVAGFDKERLHVKCSKNQLNVYLDFDSKEKRKLINSVKFYSDVNSSKIKAKLSQGILFVSVPKREKSDSVDISVE